ncbi:hypothetical protein DRE_04134 [Drechslerella stenobrocha 248]|uniref:Zn(2)-C6 fungal-type domain-containing protein n=1 Tax=Drechslerella stenobrocha 248 TaxID=1043628 RepID=W7I2L7_9PEZI|nr:hypothetical protein DRE_04134 [Drechslerella stenobrocha 248]
MSPRPAKPNGLRLSICSTPCSSNGDLSAGSVTPSSATTFSISPASSSLSLNFPFSTYSASNYAASSPSSVKEEPSTPDLFVPIDDAEDTGEAADTETSPPQDELGPELVVESSVEPKLELKLEDEAVSSSLATPVLVKRPRGRPRKNPANPPETKSKPTLKSRSKTGCLTCRKRKKKCDEGKPECNNCGKNGILCEGYNPKIPWKSGRAKLDPIHRMPPFRPSLPALIEGVESQIDRKLLSHFVETVSSVLSKFGDEKNPFKEILLPLAIDNSGLMHSMLCLAASHLARTDPSIKNAQYHHKDVAIGILRRGLNSLGHQDDSVIDDSTVATTIVLCLEAICEGDTTGAHSHHMNALNSVAQKMNERARAKDVEPRELEFARFFIEFFRYHLVLDGVTNMSRGPSTFNFEPFAEAPPFMLPTANPEVINQHLPDDDMDKGMTATTLIGLLDGLFVNISRITSLRIVIRQRKADGVSPTIDEVMLGQAVEIDQEVRSWKPTQAILSYSRYCYAMLYQQVTWIYLFRTVQRSLPDHRIRNAVDEGLKCLTSVPMDESSYSVLLMPVFILGCAAFDMEQRPEITKVLEEMQAAGLQNAIHAQKVVNKIWELMDEGNETSWDWERIIYDLDYDFLLT